MDRLARLLTSSLTLLIAILVMVAPVWAQASGSTTSAVTGIVTDPTDGVIAGVVVKVKNVDTNLVREVTTDESGTYTVVQVPPGKYELTVVLEGYTTQTSKVDLVLGSTSRLDFKMAVGSTTDIVEVTATNVIEEAKTENSTNIDKQRIESLPINRRNFLDFSLTSPRVTADRVPAQGAAATSGLSFNGQNGRVNNITIDGLDNNDFGTGSVRATFSQDAVQEFQVVSDSYSAEYGRALGGVVNIVTKGGGNDIHGGLFFLNRNDAIAARDVFSPFEPKYRQYQFGANFSGPIKKDKAFYFFSFERLSIKQNNFVTISDQTVSAANNVGFPLANGPIPFGVGTTSVLARTDLRISDKDTLWVRYNFGGNFNGSFEPYGALIGLTNGSDQRLKDNTVAANNTFIGSSGFVNESRFIYGKRDQEVNPLDPSGPQIRVVGPEGLVTFGRSTFSPQPRDLRIYQFVNNTSVIRGKNSIKFGVDFNYTNTPNLATEVPVFGGGLAFFQPIDFTALSGIPGLPVLSGLQAFDPATRTPAQIAFLQVLSGLLPGMAPGFPSGVPLAQLSLPLAYIQGFGDPRIEINAKLFSAFFQDDIKLKPNFTLKLGIRYDINRVRFVPDNNGNFSPRVSFAYRPNKLNHLSIRASYGLFFAAPITGPSFVIGRSVTGQLTQLFSPFPFSILPFALPGHHFPDSVTVPPTAGFIPQLSQSFRADPNAKNSYTQQISLGTDYTLGNSSVISVGYNFVRGIKLLSQRDINPVVRPNGNPVTSAVTGRVDPTKGTIYEFESGFDSYYHGLTLTYNRRLVNNFSIFANYTFSKSIDNFIDIRPDLSEVQFPLNIRQERSLSLQDVRHRFVISGTVDFSFIKNVVFKDFQLSTITTLNTGRPYNLQTGVDLDQNGDQPPGDRPPFVGRNAGVAPGFANVDLRLNRTFAIKEKYKLQVIAECFNLFNRVNISEIDRLYPPDANGNFNLPPQENGRFIAPRDRYRNAFAPRQFQVGFRFNF